MKVGYPHIITECCGIAIRVDYRYCPKCGCEARVLPADSPVSPEADIIAEQEVRWEREHGYYTEAAKAYEALARIVRAYDRYRGRGVIPAPDEYQTMVQAINDARLIMGPQFQLTDAPPE
jgi:hypothetical protein